MSSSRDCVDSIVSPQARLACAVALAISGLVAPDADAADCTGTIRGPRTTTCTLPSGGSLQVTSSGSIEALDGPALIIDHPENAPGSVRNSGTLTGYGDAVLLEGTQVTGDLLNNRTGALRLVDTSGLYGNAAVRLDTSTLTGNLVNAGNIDGGDAYIGLQADHTQVTGDIRNSGLIAGNIAARLIDVQLGGSLRNSGQVSGWSDGLVIQNSTILGSVLNFGTLESNSGGRALHVTGSHIEGDLINHGDILAQSFSFGAARVFDTTLGGDFVNNGRIDAGADATALVVYTGSLGNFINRGTIQGNNGLSLNAETVRGDFRNSGSIKGAFNPDGGGSGWTSVGSTFQGRLYNNGTVKAATTAIYFENTRADGRFYNSGNIQGGGIGLALEGKTVLADGLANSGVIQGGDYALYVSSNATLDNVYIAGDNTAAFVGKVSAPRTTVTLFSNATYTLQDGNRFQVERFVNRGTLGVAAVNAAGNPARATIDGDYLQTGDAVFRTHVLDDAHYGQLNVTGTATLPSQARIDVDVANASQPFTRDRLNNVIGAGTLESDGTFAVTSNSALFDFGAVKNGNEVDLTLSAKSANGVRRAAQASGLSGATGAAQVIDAQLAKGSASTLTPYFVSATGNAEVANSLSQALPLGNQALRATQMALYSINDAVRDRLQVSSGLLSANGLSGAGAHSGVWSQSFNYIGGGSGGASSNGSNGQVIGSDFRLSPQHRVGMAFAYANSGTGALQGTAPQQTRQDLWQFLGYSSQRVALDTELMVYAGAGGNRTDGRRDLSLSGANGSARSDHDSLVATFGASLGKAYQVGEDTRLLPAIRLDYSHIRENGYREQGTGALAPLLLDVDRRDTDQLIAGLDGKLEQNLGGATFLQVNLGMGYDLINQDGDVTARFAGAPQQRFHANTGRDSPWVLRSGLGLASRLNNGAEVSLNWDGQSRGDYNEQTASLNFSMRF